jgi:hypothetical protein
MRVKSAANLTIFAKYQLVEDYMKKVQPGEYIKIVDSDIAGCCIEIKVDGTLIVDTGDGLLIPVKNRRFVVSEFEKDLSETPVGPASRKAKTKGRRGDQKSPQRKSPVSQSNVIEIDLHSTLQPVTKAGPSPSDILMIQLDRFSSALRKAVADNKRELVAIHGEGSGRLRSEIRRISRELYPKLEVMDAPYHKYGNGATRILLKP